MLTSRVFLTGMMGSGKSTVGPSLASLLEFEFVDLDRELERAAGRPLSELFRESEAGFRRAEARALAEAARRSRTVIATGGGALLDQGSLAVAQAAGVIVYLRAPAGVLARRLGGGGDRPLLTDAGGRPLPAAALRRRISILLREREPAYLQADIIADVGERSADAVAAAIAEALGTIE